MKARAALDGRAVRDVTIELYERWLGDREAPGSELSAPLSGAEWLAGWQELGKEIECSSTHPRPLSEIIISERR
ncbi:MAG: hypothetical protein U0667_17955 [Chloroflexota bacterium]